LDSEPYVVIGVAGEDLAGPYFPADFWLPMPSSGLAMAAGSGWNFVLGKLRTGVALRHAQAQLSAVESSLSQENPDLDGRSLQATGLKDVLGESARPMLLVLLGASGLLLLIACGNVAFLSFLRNDQRKAE